MRSDLRSHSSGKEYCLREKYDGKKGEVEEVRVDNEAEVKGKQRPAGKKLAGEAKGQIQSQTPKPQRKRAQPNLNATSTCSLQPRLVTLLAAPTTTHHPA